MYSYYLMTLIKKIKTRKTQNVLYFSVLLFCICQLDQALLDQIILCQCPG